METNKNEPRQDNHTLASFLSIKQAITDREMGLFNAWAIGVTVQVIFSLYMMYVTNFIQIPQDRLYILGITLVIVYMTIITKLIIVNIYTKRIERYITEVVRTRSISLDFVEMDTLIKCTLSPTILIIYSFAYPTIIILLTK